MIVPLLGDNSVALRGLNLDDVMGLIPNHFEAISKVAELYSEQQEAIFSQRAISQLILTVANTFPDLLSEVISTAADEPGVRARLSPQLQIACLSAVLKLTVEDAGGLGNLFAQLRDIGRIVVEQAALHGDSLKQARSRSSTGNGGSR